MVIPTYNERESIGHLLRDVCRAAAVDVLVVDDSSPDGTADTVEEVRASERRVHLLVRPRRLGLASAYLAGFDHAVREGYDLVFEMDADYSSPAALPPRVSRPEPPGRSRVGLAIRARRPDLELERSAPPHQPEREPVRPGRSCNYTLHDLTGGFKCFRVAALRTFDLSRITSDGYYFQIELSYLFAKNGFRVVEVPIVFEERRAGQSKMSWTIALEALTKVWALRFTPAAAVRRASPQEARSRH